MSSQPTHVQPADFGDRFAGPAVRPADRSAVIDASPDGRPDSRSDSTGGPTGEQAPTRRIRDEVRDGVYVMAFSCLASIVTAGGLVLVTRLAG